MPVRTHKTFGAYIRNLRMRRALALSEAAELSDRATFDSRGRLSSPYLSQLESGRKIAVSLPKVATLAAIYATAIEDVIQHAPAGDRERLMRELLRWRAASRPLPEPLRRLPHVKAEVDAKLDALLAETAHNVALPLGMEVAARDAIRDGLTWAILPTFFARWPQCRARLPDFWAIAPRRPPPKFSTIPTIALETWQKIATECHDWILYDLGLWREVVSDLAGWTINCSPAGVFYDQAWLTCSFTAPDVQAVAGIRAVPVKAIVAVRSAQLAAALHRLVGPDDPPAAPPSVQLAALDVLQILLEAGGSGLAPDARRLSEVVASVRYVCDHVPCLAPSGHVLPVATGIAELLSQALPAVIPAAPSD